VILYRRGDGLSSSDSLPTEHAQAWIKLLDFSLSSIG